MSSKEEIVAAKIGRESSIITNNQELAQQAIATGKEVTFLNRAMLNEVAKKNAGSTIGGEFRQLADGPTWFRVVDGAIREP